MHYVMAPLRFKTVPTVANEKLLSTHKFSAQKNKQTFSL